jgi:hypothetical protein
VSEIECGEVSKETILLGKAFCGYCSYPDSRKWAAKVCGDIPHQVWYTERNGDPIVLVMPADTLPEQFPSFAFSYIVLRWMPPEDVFGSANDVVPIKWRSVAA